MSWLPGRRSVIDGPPCVPFDRMATCSSVWRRCGRNSSYSTERSKSGRAEAFKPQVSWGEPRSLPPARGSRPRPWKATRCSDPASAACLSEPWTPLPGPEGLSVRWGRRAGPEPARGGGRGEAGRPAAEHPASGAELPAVTACLCWARGGRGRVAGLLSASRPAWAKGRSQPRKDEVVGAGPGPGGAPVNASAAVI